MQGSVRYEKGSPLILRGLVAKWRLRKRLQRVVGGGGGGGGGGESQGLVTRITLILGSCERSGLKSSVHQKPNDS